MPLSCQGALSKGTRAPNEHCWVLWHEVLITIAVCPLQVRPINIVVDRGPACDLEPSLATMVGSKPVCHVNVRARREQGNVEAARIVPLLPDVETSGIVIRRGATLRGQRIVPSIESIAHCRGLRLVGEFLRHSRWQIVPQPHRHLTFAHRLCQPSMAGCL